MCHDNDSRPPAPPISGPIGATTFFTLSAADGTRFSAAATMPLTEPKAGIVVLPDVRGLHPYYPALTARLAEAGFAALALDYFGRTAGLVGEGLRETDWEYMPHVKQTRPETVDLDIAAGIEYLRSQTAAGLPLFTMGFCFGGSNSWRQSAGDLDLAGVIGFYGRAAVVGDAADAATKPVLMLIAGDDFASPVADQNDLAARMRAAGADVVSIVFPGAPHSFFDFRYSEWGEACDEAWRQILDFTARHAAVAD